MKVQILPTQLTTQFENRINKYGRYVPPPGTLVVDTVTVEQMLEQSKIRKQKYARNVARKAKIRKNKRSQIRRARLSPIFKRRARLDFLKLKIKKMALAKKRRLRWGSIMDMRRLRKNKKQSMWQRRQQKKRLRRKYPKWLRVVPRRYKRWLLTAALLGTADESFCRKWIYPLKWGRLFEDDIKGYLVRGYTKKKFKRLKKKTQYSRRFGTGDRAARFQFLLKWVLPRRNFWTKSKIFPRKAFRPQVIKPWGTKRFMKKGGLQFFPLLYRLSIVSRKTFFMHNRFLRQFWMKLCKGWMYRFVGQLGLLQVPSAIRHALWLVRWQRLLRHLPIAQKSLTIARIRKQCKGGSKKKKSKYFRNGVSLLRKTKEIFKVSPGLFFYRGVSKLSKIQWVRRSLALKKWPTRKGGRNRNKVFVGFRLVGRYRQKRIKVYKNKSRWVTPMDFFPLRTEMYSQYLRNITNTRIVTQLAKPSMITPIPRTWDARGMAWRMKQGFYFKTRKSKGLRNFFGFLRRRYLRQFKSWLKRNNPHRTRLISINNFLYATGKFYPWLLENRGRTYRWLLIDEKKKMILRRRRGVHTIRVLANRLLKWLYYVLDLKYYWGKMAHQVVFNADVVRTSLFYKKSVKIIFKEPTVRIRY